MIEKARYKTSKQTSDQEYIRLKQAKHTLVTGKYIPRDEHDVIHLRDPTED